MDPIAFTSRSASSSRAEKSAGTREGGATAPPGSRSRSLRHEPGTAPPSRNSSRRTPPAAAPAYHGALPGEGADVPLWDVRSQRSDDVSIGSDSGYLSAFSDWGGPSQSGAFQRDARTSLRHEAVPEHEVDPRAEDASRAGGIEAAATEPSGAPAQQSARRGAAAALRRRAQAALNRQALTDLGRLAAGAGSTALHGVAALGRTAVAPVTLARSHIASAWSRGSGAVLRLPKAALGHLVHQGVAVGFSTAVREVAAEAMIAGLRRAPAGALLGVELGMGVINMSLQSLRQVREKRNPDEAARGFHALSPQEWAGKTPREQAALRKEQQQHSDRVVALQVTSLMVNVGFAVHGMLRGDSSFAASSIASEAKTIVYALMRDSIQSKFGMVKIDGSHGVSRNYLAGAAMLYGGSNMATAYAWSVLPPLVLPKGMKVGLSAVSSTGVTAGDVRDVLRGGMVEGLSLPEAIRATAKMIGVKAALNTALETSDWFAVNQQEANQAGSQQVLAPHIKPNDFGRLKDHAVTRLAIINHLNSMGEMMAVVTKGLPAGVSSLLTNGALSVLSAVHYKTITSTWQAEGAVRSAEDRQPPAARGTENA